MSDDDLAMMAAEYALGTLDRAERVEFGRRLARDPAARALVQDWERRLAPLSSAISETAPDLSLLDRIEAEIDSRQSGGNVVALRRSVTRWRVSTGAAGALAASLAIFAVMRGQVEEIVAPPSTQVAQAIPHAPTPGLNPAPRSAAAAPQAQGAVTARSERGAGGVTLATGDAGNRGGVSLEPRASSWSATLAPVADRAGLAAELDSEGVLTVRRLAGEPPAGKEIALWLLAPERAPKPIGVLTRDFGRFTLSTALPEGAELAASLEPDDNGAPAQPSAAYAYKGRLVRQ
jgi:anti-sigma-K factor RskA